MNNEDIKNTFSEVVNKYPLKIPKDIKRLVYESEEDSPLRAQFLPSHEEINPTLQKDGFYDPIADFKYSKGNGIIHRYKNRLLFTPTTACPVNCRYCFRKNELAQNDEIFKSNLKALINYLALNPDVEEVILTGGDPLSLNNKRLEEIFSNLSGKIAYLRIHTRFLTTSPSRIDDGFINLLNKYVNQFDQFSIAIHANHKDEFFDLAREKIKALSNTNVVLLSQSVLLKGVNNSEKELIDLMKEFIKLKIRPYYLHHPDLVQGAMHFYLPLEEGRKIYGKLRESLPGWAIPNYIIDSPTGNGKNFAYNPESIKFSGIILDRFNQENTLLPN